MTRSVLNIGCGPSRELPPHFRGFHVMTLDIDASAEPDVIGDARDLSAFADESFDAVYMSHVLETFERWEVLKALGEATRVLKVGGFLEIHVPNVKAVFEAVLDGGELDTPLFVSGHGPVTALDLLYGNEESVQRGNNFMEHHTAFTGRSLRRAMEDSGLQVEFCQQADRAKFQLCAIGRKVAEGVIAMEEAFEQEMPRSEDSMV